MFGKWWRKRKKQADTVTVVPARQYDKMMQDDTPPEPNQALREAAHRRDNIVKNEAGRPEPYTRYDGPPAKNPAPRGAVTQRKVPPPVPPVQARKPRPSGGGGSSRSSSSYSGYSPLSDGFSYGSSSSSSCDSGSSGSSSSGSCDSGSSSSCGGGF